MKNRWKDLATTHAMLLLALIPMGVLYWPVDFVDANSSYRPLVFGCGDGSADVLAVHVA